MGASSLDYNSNNMAAYEIDLEDLDSSDEEVILECSADDTDISEEGEESYAIERAPRPCSYIQPYMFEPDQKSKPEQVDEVQQPRDQAAPRTQNTDWCSCGKCHPMPVQRECRCCREIPQIMEWLDGTELDCITLHPGFYPVCLNQFVLATAWSGYKFQYGTRAFTGEDHERNRHVSYRQFVQWCWGALGRNNRVVLPSCVVNIIRAEFPPPGLEENAIFTGFMPA